MSQEPAVHTGKIRNFVGRPAAFESSPDYKNTGWRGTRQGAAHLVIGHCLERLVFSVSAEPAAADLQGTQGFLKGLLEGASDAHGFPDRFHLGAQGIVCRAEFFEGKTRDLGHHVINRRLEAGGGFTRYII